MAPTVMQPAGYVPVMPSAVAYPAPGMPQMYPGTIPGAYPGGARPMPHKINNPGCHKCHGTGWKAYKNKPCGRCVCKKCGGTGFNAKKHKPCLKIKLKH